MKKQLLATGLLAAISTLGYAQSTVSIYGILGAGIRSAPNLAVSEDRLTTMDDGMRSRFGFRGTEDLGRGGSPLTVQKHKQTVLLCTFGR